MRKKIVAGNWKMNNNLPESLHLCKELIQHLPSTDASVIIFPTFVSLYEISKETTYSKAISLGAQNVHPMPNGAFTGEVSVAMLQSVGVEYVLVGHSERREYFKEDEAFLKQKVDAVLNAGMKPVFCCGESLTIRNEQKHEAFVKNQLEKSLFHLTATQLLNCIIAYEPVWAIGTGVNATSAQAQQMHLFIRNLIAERYSNETAQSISILYGGSCKPDNAKELFSQPDVDGGLIGGASLKANDFIQIIQSI